ncbi:unnamed protein product [Cochlearia groenlandica]
MIIHTTPPFFAKLGLPNSKLNKEKLFQILKMKKWSGANTLSSGESHRLKGSYHMKNKSALRRADQVFPLDLAKKVILWVVLLVTKQQSQTLQGIIGTPRTRVETTPTKMSWTDGKRHKFRHKHKKNAIEKNEHLTTCKKASQPHISLHKSVDNPFFGSTLRTSLFSWEKVYNRGLGKFFVMDVMICLLSYKCLTVFWFVLKTIKAGQTTRWWLQVWKNSLRDEYMVLFDEKSARHDWEHKGRRLFLFTSWQPQVKLLLNLVGMFSYKNFVEKRNFTSNNSSCSIIHEALRKKRDTSQYGPDSLWRLDVLGKAEKDQAEKLVHPDMLACLLRFRVKHKWRYKQQQRHEVVGGKKQLDQEVLRGSKLVVTQYSNFNLEDKVDLKGRGRGEMREKVIKYFAKKVDHLLSNVRPFSFANLLAAGKRIQLWPLPLATRA